MAEVFHVYNRYERTGLACDCAYIYICICMLYICVCIYMHMYIHNVSEEMFTS